jgi:electron-transferring-flavoprotein dehydrogenase
MSASNGAGPHAPSEFPPPVEPLKEFVKHGLDDEDELIEVGVAIVGGGTAGLACANRLLQLLGDDEALMERLGEVPVAVIEKAKTCGGHNLSGAVMRPGPLQELFPELSREDWRKEHFAFGEVTKESVYLLTSAKTKLPVPIPFVPNFKNHGNEVVSVAALARYQARMAEEGGAYILTETSASQLVVQDGKVVGVRSGDKGRGKDGEPLGNFEPGTDIKAKVTVLAEGCWGHLTGAAIKEFELAEGREPQVWELGVKEVWKVPKPLDRVIHTFTQPWPMKISPKYGQLGGTWIYPMKDEKTGEDLVSIGFVVDLNYRDATTSPHDLLQQFKLHPLVKGILEGGERIAWGAKALPGGGYWSMPKLSMPGAVLVGDAGGMVDTAALKGVHHCIKSGMLAAEAIYRSLKDGESLESYEQAVEESTIGQELYRSATPASRSRRASYEAACWPAPRSCPRARSRAGARPGTPTTRSRCSSAIPAPVIPSPTTNTPSTSCRRSTSPATRRATTPPTTSVSTSTFPGRSPRPGGTCVPRASTRSPMTRPRPVRST